MGIKQPGNVIWKFFGTEKASEGSIAKHPHPLADKNVLKEVINSNDCLS